SAPVPRTTSRRRFAGSAAEAVSPSSWRILARQHPASLFEDSIGARVERSRRLRDGQVAVDDALGHEPYLVGDPLPFGDFRRRLHALELLSKCARINVVGERAFGPRTAPRRQVAGELVKASLDRRLRQIFDQLPSRGIVACTAKQ